MAQRKPKQSQLDYLWTNFGELSKLKKQGDRLIGFNESGEELFQLDFEGSSSGASDSTIIDFGKRQNEYYITLSDGTEFTAPSDLYEGSESNSFIISIEDNVISGQLKLNNEDSLIILSETDNGLKADISEDLKEGLTILEDLTELKNTVDSNNNTLLLLNGDENQEGSVLNIVTTNINNAFNWQEI